MFRNLFLICIFFTAISNSYSQESFKVGDTVPEFKLWFIDGSKLTKNDIQDKVVVFKFWFTSCLPCLLDISQLNELSDELKHRDDVLFLAPALDRKDIIKEFVTVNPLKFKVAYSSMDVSQVFNKKQVYPSYFIIDKKGKFVYVDNGTKQSNFNNLREAVLKIIKE